MTGKRMSPLDDQINVIRDVSKELTSVAVLKSLEDFTNTVRCNRHIDSPSLLLVFYKVRI